MKRLSGCKPSEEDTSQEVKFKQCGKEKRGTENRNEDNAIESKSNQNENASHCDRNSFTERLKRLTQCPQSLSKEDSC